ncbi:AIR synthase related protein [Saccharolobus caldissimus]|uniref:Thiamine-monophosphate kinase n=1 Tax=Saccharolobus caldissimus TaxID=1702097 RepID=A0AAQ4CMV3_9CREN|nr:AIR synthase related protein [Saccharolobus caldissimus]BDB97134.1 thiamine-monophosphate kinase [Saccharolobus caldissimus]
MRLKDIGEHNFIRKYIMNYIDIKKLEDTYIEENKGYKVDGFKLSYTFPFMTYYDIGWRAITASTSDIITKGIKPNIYLVSLGLNGDLELEKVNELLKGISDAIHYYGGKYVGGDLNDSDYYGWVDVFIEGDLMCNTDKQIAINDYVLIGDFIGYTTNIFISYLNKFKVPILKKSLIKMKHPIVNKSLLYFLKKYCKYIKYSTDISDGLVISLYNIINNFNVGIYISYIPIDINVAKLLINNFNVTEMDFLKYSGEEFLPILILDKNSPIKDLLKDLKYLGYNPSIIGKIINKSCLIYKNTEIKITGWDNFLGWY